MARRLPSWMLAQQANDPVVKRSRDEVNKAGHSNDGLAPESRPTRKRKNSTPREENETPKDEQVSVVQGGRKRGRRKTSVQDEDLDGEIEGIVAEGKESKRSAESVRGKAPRGRKRRKEQIDTVDKDNESPDITDGGDDMDLTVEDLMSIANEYISADSDHKERYFSRQESRTEISAAEARNHFDAVSNEPRPPPTSISTSEETATRDEIVPPIEMTGDPARDMLNLLLGPLLNKNVKEEKNRKDELLTSSVMVSKEFSYIQSANLVESVPQTKKKKTSLKDKIAMFLE